MKIIDSSKAEQLVLNQMDNDAAGHHGPATIKHKISVKTGVHLTREFVTNTMRAHDSKGFEKRNPKAKRFHYEPKVPLGINERWSADGHDKLNSIGFPVWAIVDDAVGLWIDCWVVPSNRLGNIFGFLFLDAVETAGGVFMSGLVTVKLC